MEEVFHTLEAWCWEDSKILLLGSMPSVQSRKENCYYAHPSNRFWKVLEILFQEKITDRKLFCQKHHLALWDTIYSCQIHSSSDASIKNVIPNDLTSLLKKTNIQQIFTIGKKSHEVYVQFLYPKIQKKDICLPSTSSLNASFKLEDLVAKFQILLDYID